MSIPSEILRINIGDVANDGSGDDLRDAFIKVNNNFLYVGTRLGLAVSGANVGVTGESIFKEVVDAQLRFRKIGGGSNIFVETVDDVITANFAPTSTLDINGQDIINAGFNISGAGPIRLLAGGTLSDPNNNYTQLQWATNIETPDLGKNSYVWLDADGVHISTADYTGDDPPANYDNQWWFKNNGGLELPGGGSLVPSPAGIDLVASPGGWAEIASNNGNNYIWVDDTGAYIGVNWNIDPKMTTFGLDGSVTFPGDINTTGNISAVEVQAVLQGAVFGTVNGNVTGLIRTEPDDTYVDVSALNNGLNTFDFGVINPVYPNSFKDPMAYLLYALGADMGTFNNPGEYDIDAGSIVSA